MITLEQFIVGLQNTINNIPGVIKEWDTIDDFLIEEYIESFNWMMKEIPEFKRLAYACERGEEFDLILSNGQSVLSSFEDFIKIAANEK